MWASLPWGDTHINFQKLRDRVDIIAICNAELSDQIAIAKISIERDFLPELPKNQGAVNNICSIAIERWFHGDGGRRPYCTLGHEFDFHRTVCRILWVSGSVFPSERHQRRQLRVQARPVTQCDIRGYCNGK